jgi:hypothetical protein
MDWTAIAAARKAARRLLGLAVITVAGFTFLWVSAPESIGPMFGAPEVRLFGVPATELILGIGVFGPAVGLLWMWRIYRAPTTTESGRWRYRDR